jgi:hypothetical protein
VVRFLPVVREFSRLHSVDTSSGTYTASYLISAEDKAVRA